MSFLFFYVYVSLMHSFPSSFQIIMKQNLHIRGTTLTTMGTHTYYNRDPPHSPVFVWSFANERDAYMSFFFFFWGQMSLWAVRSSYGGHHLAYECIHTHHRSCERNSTDMAAKIIGIKLVIEHTYPSVLTFSFIKLEGSKKIFKGGRLESCESWMMLTYDNFRTHGSILSDPLLVIWLILRRSTLKKRPETLISIVLSWKMFHSND